MESSAYGRPVLARRPELFDERNARHARDNPDPDQQAMLDLHQPVSPELALNDRKTIRQRGHSVLWLR